MEMETAIWTELLKQGAVVATAVWLLTQFLPFGAKAKAKRGMAVLYACFLTFGAYLVGAIRLPQVVAPEFTESALAKFFVLFLVAVLTAAETMIAHDLAGKVFTKKSNKPGLPE